MAMEHLALAYLVLQHVRARLVLVQLLVQQLDRLQMGLSFTDISDRRPV